MVVVAGGQRRARSRACSVRRDIRPRRGRAGRRRASCPSSSSSAATASIASNDVPEIIPIDAHAQLLLLRGSAASRSPSPRKLKPTTAIDDRERRRGQRPPGDPGQAARVGHHLPERCGRRRRAEAEEAEARLGEDRPREREARLHGDHAVDARQDVAEEQRGRARTRAPARRARSRRCAATAPGARTTRDEDRDPADADRERAVEDARPECGHDRQREQDRRDREDRCRSRA